MKKIWLLILCLSVSLLAGAKEKEKKNLTPLKPALLVIDIQNEYLPMMADEDKKMALEMINGAIWLFRQRNLPVIRVYHTNPEWGPKPGTENFEFPKNILVKPEDAMIIKNHPSAFTQTELEKLLREKGCNIVFLCGLSATGCVLATYYGAMDKDFRVFMIKGALLSPNATFTKFAEDICDAIGFEVVQFILDLAVK